MLAKLSEARGRPAEKFTEPPLHLIEELRELLKRTDVADPSGEDRQRFVRFLDDHPGLIEWLPTSEGVPERIMLERLATGKWATQEIMRREGQELRAQLGYDAAPMLERLLIDRIVVCKLRLVWAEAVCMQEVSRTHEIITAEYLDRMLSRAQRRFQSACESLARVRSLKPARKRPKSRGLLRLLAGSKKAAG
jgi:hypothetical protein